MKMTLATGIDWAAGPRDRAMVALVNDGLLGIERFKKGLEDRETVGICSDKAVDVVAVDVPFGWPKRFCDFVKGWSAKPSGRFVGSVPQPSQFLFRTTETVVKKELGKTPLSVSTNLIGRAAHEWARVVKSGAIFERIDVGVGHHRRHPTVVEVYPAATLAALSTVHKEITPASYKKDPSARAKLVDSLAGAFEISAKSEQKRAIAQDCDLTDAFLAALSGMIYLGKVEGWTVRRPKVHEEVKNAASEGWIFFPVAK